MKTMSLKCRAYPEDELRVRGEKEDVHLMVRLLNPDPHEPYNGHGVRLTRASARNLHRYLGEWLNATKEKLK